MQNSIEATASALEALSIQYQVTANNLANVSTAGFKRQRATFAQVLQEQMAPTEPGAPAETALPQLVGAVATDFSQGSLIQTDRPLDVALEGPGFLVVETPQGPLYTRNGSLQRNAQGQLVDGSGRTIAGEGGPITVPPSGSEATIRIASDGSVSVGGAAIGKLRLVEFARPGELKPQGGNCFSAGGVGPAAATKTSVRQGCQESSNVSAVEELVGLIMVSRLYEANIKAMTTQDERVKSLLQVAMA